MYEIQWCSSPLCFFATVMLDLKSRPRDLAEGFRLITLNVPQELGLDSIITNYINDGFFRVVLYLGWIETPMFKETMIESLLLLLNDNALPLLECFLYARCWARVFAYTSHFRKEGFIKSHLTHEQTKALRGQVTQTNFPDIRRGLILWISNPMLYPFSYKFVPNLLFVSQVLLQAKQWEGLWEEGAPKNWDENIQGAVLMGISQALCTCQALCCIVAPFSLSWGRAADLGGSGNQYIKEAPVKPINQSFLLENPSV